jgi:flagellum-specific peptidoglycan hydrolase FlgJ
MKHYSHLLCAGLLTLLFCTFSSLQASEATEGSNRFISEYQDMARRVAARTQIPVSIVLGQAILESGSGTSVLSKRTNNFFGIRIRDTYQKFDSDEASFKRYAHILSKKARYAHLFDLNPLDYIAWAEAIANAGYAEDPEYAKKLIAVIRTHKLYKLDDPEQIQLHLTDTGMIQRDHLIGRNVHFSRESLAYLAMQAEQERNKTDRRLKKAPYINRRVWRKNQLA